MATTDLERLVVQLSTDFKAFERGMLKAHDITQRDARKIERRFGQMNKNIQASFNSTGAIVQRSIAALGLGLGTKEIISYADAWTRSRARIQVAGVALSDVGTKQEELLKIANDSRTSFESVVDIYSRLGIASRELGTSQKDLTRITETLAKAVQLGGASSTEARAAVLQFSQALASGVLQGDELRSIRENAPLVAQAIAQEFGVTVGELKKLGEQGELTSERIMRAMLKVAPAVAIEFERLPRTVGQSMTVIGNQTLAIIGSFDQWSGSTQRLIGWLSALADVMSLVASSSKEAELELLNRQIASQQRGFWGSLGNAALGAISPIAGQADALDNAQRLLDLERRRADLIEEMNGGISRAERERIQRFEELNEKADDLRRKIEEAERTGTGIAFLEQWKRDLTDVLTLIASIGPAFERVGRGTGIHRLFDIGGSATGVGGAAATFQGSKGSNKSIYEEYQRALEKAARAEEQAQNKLDAINRRFVERAERAIAGYEKLIRTSYDRVRALDMETAALGMTEAEAEKLRIREELLNRVRESGIEINQRVIADIEAVAQAYGEAVQRQEDAEKRMATIKEFSGELTGAFKGFFSEMASGVAPIDALTNALGRLQQKLLDLALNSIFDQLFGGEGGIARYLFGAFGSSGADSAYAVGKVYHTGGRVGSGGTSRRVPASVFAGAPRMHRGGLAGDEVPAILQRGEMVIPRGMAARGASGFGKVTVNNYGGGRIETRERSGPDGRQLEILVHEAVRRGMSTGLYDGAAGGRWGVQATRRRT